MSATASNVNTVFPVSSEKKGDIVTKTDLEVIQVQKDPNNFDFAHGDLVKKDGANLGIKNTDDNSAGKLFVAQVTIANPIGNATTKYPTVHVVKKGRIVLKNAGATPILVGAYAGSKGVDVQAHSTGTKLARYRGRVQQGDSVHLPTDLPAGQSGVFDFNSDGYP
jgi:hypothetical protein